MDHGWHVDCVVSNAVHVGASGVGAAGQEARMFRRSECNIFARLLAGIWTSGYAVLVAGLIYVIASH